jgi:hypothetical protein
MLVCVCVCTRGFTPGVLQETRTVTRRAALRTASLGNELLAKCIQPGSAVVASVTTGSTDSGMQRQRRGNCGLCVPRMHVHCRLRSKRQFASRPCSRMFLVQGRGSLPMMIIVRRTNASADHDPLTAHAALRIPGERAGGNAERLATWGRHRSLDDWLILR